ncbi:MAG TPA: NAD(P)H-binding protein [Polyangiaceae bacterium]|nr:NAD(P)H-binding protein [Polyangiaceae bacterium]
MSLLREAPEPSLRVFVVGATGYIGRHVVRTLLADGHDVVCLVRRDHAGGEGFGDAEARFGDVTDPRSVAEAGFRGERFDAVVSCLATRTGVPEDAWAIEHRANLNVLEASKAAGVRHFVLLSAICVQKPLLAFQEAKLRFERALIDSAITYSIVRPTAFFKSLAGQVEKVKRGAPFLVFGDGELTACKPISERDLARFVVSCLTDPSKRDAILPVGGPGPAITPKGQGALLAELLGRAPRYRRAPVRMLDVIGRVLRTLGRVFPRLRDKAELVAIGRYYATESMLVFDAARGRYDADATPSFGEDTLRAFYARVLRDGLAGQELREHSLFSRDAVRSPSRHRP